MTKASADKLDATEHRKRVNELLDTYLTRSSRQIKAIEVGSITLGTLIAGVFALGWPQNFPFSDEAPIIAVVGLLMAAFGGVLAFVSQPVSNEILLAKTVSDEAEALRTETKQMAHDIRTKEQEFREIERAQYENEETAERLASLYNALTYARGVIETALVDGETDTTKLIDTCLTQMMDDLQIAMDFTARDVWTICIYKTTLDETGAQWLECIAHARKIDCDLKDARKWQRGVGAAGIALATNMEVPVPDTSAPETGSVFQLPGPMGRDHDPSRYASLFAVPINLHGYPTPWGVVCATKDKPYIFGAEWDEREGVAPEEGVRLLAGVVALAAAVTARTDH